MPRSYCVAIGPFTERNRDTFGNVNVSDFVKNGPRFARSLSLGEPRSHDRPSKSPKMWQLAHAESPWAEVWRALYRNGRPSMMLAGSGLNMCRRSVTVRDRVSMTTSSFVNHART